MKYLLSDSLSLDQIINESSKFPIKLEKPAFYNVNIELIQDKEPKKFDNKNNAKKLYPKFLDVISRKKLLQQNEAIEGNIRKEQLLSSNEDSKNESAETKHINL